MTTFKQGDRVICKGFTPAYEGLAGTISRMKSYAALVRFDGGFSTTIELRYLVPIEETP